MTVEPTQAPPSPARYLRALSRRRVLDCLPSGPVLDLARSRRYRLSPGTLGFALSRRDRFFAALLTLGWVSTLAWFWGWWAQPQHRVGWSGFVVNTVLMLHVSALPLYFFIMVNRIRVVAPALAIPRLRVAMLVTKVPSEPWPLVRNTLEAMLGQQFPYPYDVWLCDEGPDWAGWARTRRRTHSRAHPWRRRERNAGARP